MKTYPHIGSYIEPGYAPEPVYLSDEVYTQVLDANRHRFWAGQNTFLHLY